MSEASGMNPEIVGQTIETFSVIGEERDIDGKRVGVDAVVQAGGSFLLNVVTRDKYRSDILKGHIADREVPELLLLTSIQPDWREPYVVNSPEVSDDILAAEFNGRVIDNGLAASMFPL